LPSLSNPAANPTGFLKLMPATIFSLCCTEKILFTILSVKGIEKSSFKKLKVK
jgi:hypothetical protein